MSFFRRASAGALSLVFLSSLASPSIASTAPIGIGGSAATAKILYQLSLPHGEKATVYRNGVAQIFSKDHRSIQTRLFPITPRYSKFATTNTGLPDKAHMLADLAIGPPQPFAPNVVVVVYTDGVTAPQDLMTLDKPTLLALRETLKRHALSYASAPRYTTDASTNQTLAQLGVDSSERLFRSFNRSMLSSIRANTRAINGRQTLNFANAYRLHITGSSVRRAVAALLKLPTVVYASPDWSVGPMHATAVPLDSTSLQAARTRALTLRRPIGGGALPADIPTNYAVSASAQSLLNAPSGDAIAAYDEISSRFHQIPGQGETITNVSLGDLDDAGATTFPCNFYAGVLGPTTEMLGGQRYLNLPSMPLIPTYTADASGNVNGAGEVCGVDPQITEIGLDFSVMAPLPHNLQRPGEQGAGLTDLLGVAPGANYRLVVPATFTPAITDVQSALLGAALQTPRTDVITASLGYGFDSFGFPSRYLEEDPLTEAIVQAIVQNFRIVVCIAGGDGMRAFTTVAIGPSGGSAPTDLIAPGGTPTNLTDLELSTAPSQLFDSGAIDVGGTTLDDIFANPPQYATASVPRAQHAYAETRFTGFTSFSSAFGSRVDVSAPSDNIIGFAHQLNGADDSVALNIDGGTSASAPEAAAAAAVVLQVARLTGHPFSTPAEVRHFLAQTGTPVANISQADRNLNVGPQIDLRRAVETLLESGGVHGKAAVAGVAIEQRRDFANLDGVFVGDTDPGNIDLQGSQTGGADGSDLDQLAWITIAPNWEFVQQPASYRLYVAGHPTSLLATTPWARLLPSMILHAAALPLISSSARTVKLTYQGGAATTTFSLTFGPSDPTVVGALAPKVSGISTGSTISVSYDLTNVRGLTNPQLIVSEPGRIDPATGPIFHPAFTTPLPAGTKGTINVPTSALQGGGVYGVGIQLDNSGTYFSDFAFTRLEPSQAIAIRPAAPLLASNGSTPGHFLEIPYGAPFQVQYDVSNVSGATGAMLEISAGGPTAYGIYDPFNNPNGSIRDHNGVDSGSIYFVALPGASGTATINPLVAGLFPTMNHTVRVVPMKSGVAAGEAGEVSTITMDGVFASDGGFVNNGYGINPNGLDGFLTSGQQMASGQVISSLESFDQTSNAIVQNIASGSNSLFFTLGWGIYGNDIGLFGDENTSTFASSYSVLNTVSGGIIGSAWTPPSPNTLLIVQPAVNAANDNAAFLAFDTSTVPAIWRVFSSNIAANTFSPKYDVSGPLNSFQAGVYAGFGENTTTKTGVLAGGDLANACGPPTIATVSLANGKIGSFQGMGAGLANNLAVDSVTNKAAVLTSCDAGLTVYDLASHAGSEVLLPGASSGLDGLYLATDQASAKILVSQTVGPDVFTNNNSISRVLVYDENGNLLETLQRFNLFNQALNFAASNLLVNPARHQGYLIGLNGRQIEPFNY